MTLEKAQQITDLVTAAYAQAERGLFMPLSMLKGHSLIEVDRAFRLTVAKEYHQLVGTASQLSKLDRNLGNELPANFEERLKRYAVLSTTLRQTFIGDEDFNRLSKLPEKSPEHLMLRGELFLIQHRNQKQVWLNEESLESFANYCKKLGTQDLLYWQKIYTHLGLPYEVDSPRGAMKLDGTFGYATNLEIAQESQRSSSWSISTAGACFIIAVLVLLLIVFL